VAVTVERVVECRNDVAHLWPVLTDTGYLNRAAGLAPLALTPIADGSAARFRVRTRAGGFNVEWDEAPFEWREHERFNVRRQFRTGPISSIDTAFSFAAKDAGGTRVTITLVLTPKSSLLAPIVRLGASRQLKTLAHAVARADRAVADAQPLPPLPQPVSRDGLERAREALVAAGTARPLAEQLCRFVSDERDERVARIRPFELADAWGHDRRELLAACLRAVGAGLLELRWELICPSCRGPIDAVPTMQALKDHGECHLCEIGFGIEDDEAVEATFSPPAHLRAVDRGRYCVGGPAMLPHVLAQAVLPARGRAELRAPETLGPHRLFVRSGGARTVTVAAAAPDALALDDAGSDAVSIAPRGSITITSAADVERHVKLERPQIRSQAATAREVTAMPGFRRDFSAEVLRADVSLKVSRVALLFTDLTASTQLYSAVGDAPALRLVHDHFDVVIGTIEAHGGTLVKTIGDAVMAAFSDELQALRTSLLVLAAFNDFRKRDELAQRTHIKMGLHAGPSYLVTANGVLDYFGQTVNIAARVQAQADSGQLVIPVSLADTALARGILDGGMVLERFTARLKGIDAPIQLVRLGTPDAVARTG
jgi:class 3 adenylate cyclase